MLTQPCERAKARNFPSYSLACVSTASKKFYKFINR